MTAPAAAPSRAAATRIVVRGLLLPLVAGAACVFGFAPFHAWIVPMLALAVLFHAWTASGSAVQAALTGFAFGLGYFLAGVSWVYVSLHVYGAMPAVLAAVATFLFCAYLALFPALAGGLAWRISRGARGRLLAAMPASFVLMEWLRGWLFTGFPWLNLGTSQAPASPLVGFAPVVGAYGVSLAVAGVAVLCVALILSDAWSRNRFALLGGLVAILAGGGALRLVEWTVPAGAPVTMALLQGNVPQNLKFRDETRLKTLSDYRAMIRDAKARVVVLPETALPAFLDRLPPGYLDDLRAHAIEAKKDILLGALERTFSDDRFAYYNSVVRLGDGPPQSFRKRHLVPFGEFIPWGFRWVLDILHIPLTDFSRGAATQPPLVAAGTAFGVTVCYEDIFGEELVAQLPEAKILLNVSNTAWFGESLASDQHLQSSQMRSLEMGRWSARATNTGVTAVVDERGRVVSRLPQFTVGTLVESVVPRTGATPFVHGGNVPALLILVAMLAVAFGRRRPS